MRQQRIGSPLDESFLRLLYERNGLGLHLGSGGETIDAEANDAWLASDPGKAFLHSCAGSWGRAHAAAGEDAKVAEAMAARTASFYSGD